MTPADQHRKLLVPNIEQPGGREQFSGGQQAVTIAALQAATGNLVNVSTPGARFVSLENHSSHAIGVAFKNQSGTVQFYALLAPLEERNWIFPAPVQSIDLQDIAYNPSTPAGTMPPAWSLSQRDDAALVQLVHTVLSGGMVIVTYADQPIVSRRAPLRTKPTNITQSAAYLSGTNATLTLPASQATSVVAGGLAYGPFTRVIGINTSNQVFGIQLTNNTLGTVSSVFILTGGNPLVLDVECDSIVINFIGMTSGMQQVIGLQTVTMIDTQAY